MQFVLMENLPANQMQHKEVQEVEVLNLDNPKSVVSLLPEKVREKVLHAVTNHKEWFNIDEGNLHLELRSNQKRPKAVDDILRMKFWLEYDRAVSHGLTKMNLANVTAGIVSKEFFHSQYLREPSRVAWLLCPPMNYLARLNEIHYQAYCSLSEIIREPTTDDHGNFDLKLAHLKVKIFEIMDARINGPIVQLHKHDVTNKNLNLNANLTPSAERSLNLQIEEKGVEGLEKKLAQLQRENKILSHLPLAPGEVEAAPQILNMQALPDDE